MMKYTDVMRQMMKEERQEGRRFKKMRSHDGRKERLVGKSSCEVEGNDRRRKAPGIVRGLKLATRDPVALSLREKRSTCNILHETINHRTMSQHSKRRGSRSIASNSRLVLIKFFASHLVTINFIASASIAARLTPIPLHPTSHNP